MENLREFLSQFNASEPYFFGYRLKPYIVHSSAISVTHCDRFQRRGYNSGGTYVLSNGAMRLFAERLYNNSRLCPCADFEDFGIAM